MFFGFLKAVGAGEESMAVENFQRARQSLVSCVYIGPTIVGPGKKFSKERLSASWTTLF